MNNQVPILDPRNEQRNREMEFEEAIRSLKETLLRSPPQDHVRLIPLSDLGQCFHDLFKLREKAQDLEEALRYFKEALDLPLSDDERAGALTNLGHCLLTGFEQQGDPEFLKAAIKLNEDALHRSLPNDPNRSIILNNLANALDTSYLHTGNIEQLNEAIRLQREALESCKPEDRSGMLDDLGIVLFNYFGAQREGNALEEAIQCHREASDLSSQLVDDKARALSCLGTCLIAKYEHLGDAQWLQEAALHLKEALECRPPGHTDRPSTLNSLANCLHCQYRETQALSDLEEAIRYLRESLSLLPSENPNWPGSLCNLVACLESKLENQGQQVVAQDFKEVISLLTRAINTFPKNHPFLADAQARLAVIYADNAELLKSSHPVQQFSDLFEQAVNHHTASVHHRFEISLKWIDRAEGPSALRAYEKCLELADRYLLVKASILSRVELISTKRSNSTIPPRIASRAAECAIENGNIRKAVELLEQGRTMLLSQIARYRTALDSLREADPKLEEEFKGVSLQLEASALLPSTVGRSSNMTAELEAFKYWKIAEQWRNCITKIQQLEGFEDFLKPPKYPTLQQAAVNGPVVIVNLGLNRSHALIMQKIGDPITLELVDARPEVFDGHVTAFLDAVHLTEKTESEEARGIKMLTQILSQLWRTVASPVVEQLQIIGWQRLSRIWWCPTSSLALLPLHAAGPHDGRQENLPDIYISSYTSTISALMKSLARSPVQPDPEDTPKLLFVAQPGIKGLSRYLPSVMEELKGVVEVIGEKSVTQLVNKKSDVVLAEMQRHRWVHFACHGSQAQDAPFDSSLELNDKYLTLLDIIQARLPDAQLAFLAICQSAKGDQTRPDETLHLGSGLQFVGFRSVIGTMYSMDDQDGPFLAKEVYGYMLKHEHNDYSDAAKALHNAVKNLKKKGVALYRWINYVHIGA